MMDGSATGMAAAHDTITGHFLPGHSEYRARERRIGERLVQLQAEYEDGPLLPIIARHLDDAARGRSAYRRQRASNSAARLLAKLSRKTEPPPPPLIAYAGKVRKP